MYLVDTDGAFWRTNLDDDITDYLMLVHLFGKVDSPFCSIWALQKILKFLNSNVSDVVLSQEKITLLINGPVTTLLLV